MMLNTYWLDTRCGEIMVVDFGHWCTTCHVLISCGLNLMNGVLEVINVMICMCMMKYGVYEWIS